MPSLLPGRGLGAPDAASPGCGKTAFGAYTPRACHTQRSLWEFMMRWVRRNSGGAGLSSRQCYLTTLDPKPGPTEPGFTVILPGSLLTATVALFPEPWVEEEWPVGTVLTPSAQCPHNR